MKKILLFTGALFFSVFLFAQQKTISGTVTDKANSKPLIGVTVILKGTQTATFTDGNGQFTLSVPGPGGSLIFSYVGYDSLSAPIGEQTVFNISMQAGNEKLDEVVVVGYGTQIKSQMTGSVSTVAASEIEHTPASTVEQTLQGKVAGVYIEANNGKVGSAIEVRIRGSSSITANNQPLYVVDGIPINTSPVNDEVNLDLNPLNDIDFNDIESVSVLKDASAAAIYGSRGANGVIIITTKHGKAGKPKVDFDFQTGFSKPTHLRQFLNAQQYISFFSDAAVRGAKYDFANGVSGYPSEDAAIADYTSAVHDQFTELSGWADWTKNQVNTDWQSLAFQNATSTTANLSISGGTDNLQYSISSGYTKQAGILLNNDMTRASGLVNIDGKFNQDFKYGVSLDFSRSLNNDVPNDDDFSSPMQMVAESPITPLYDLKGNLSTTPVTTYSNPLLELDNTTSNNYTDRFIGNVYGELTIIPSLSLRGEAGGDFTDLSSDRYYGLNSNTGFATGGYGDVYNARVENYDMKLLLKYSNSFNKDNTLEATTGMEYEPFTNYSSSVNGQGFPNDYLKTLSSASQIVAGTSSLDAYRFLSYFARANYNYKGKYLLDFTGRADGSSRFGENDRYGFFPSGSAGWVMSKEPFLENNHALSFLKLRLSYGVTGNAGIGEFNYLGLYGVSSYNGSAGLYPSTLANPNLRWEKTAQLDAGVDYGFLDDRINGELDYYVKNTSDLLLDVPVPSTTGFTTQLQNVGKMQNKGVEIELNADILVKRFKWSTSVNFADNKNEVVALNSGQTLIDEGGSSGMNVVMVGQPLGVFYGAEYAGVNPANGDALWYVNGSEGDRTTTNDFNSAHFVVIGDPNPKFIAGMTNSFSYDGFTLDVDLQGVYGNKIDLNGDHWMNSNGTFWDNQIVDALNSWKNPGDITNVPEARYEFDNGNEFRSSRYISDGSYMRLKVLTLGYDFPKSIIRHLNLSELRLYTSAYNLFTVTNYQGWDPEVSTDLYDDNVDIGVDFYSAPQPKTIVFGINVGF
jgi:TonB-dependent starch-binding outer membrane protein SusC